MVQRPTRAEIGRLGEQIAATFLVDHGYRVEATNVANSGGEIDIVVSGADGRIAVEVKTTTDGVDPTEALDHRKLEALNRAIAALPIAVQRLDVIAVRISPRGAEVRWLRDVS